MGWLTHEQLAAYFGSQWQAFPWGWFSICGLFFWAGYLVWDWTSSTPRLRLAWPWPRVSIKFGDHFTHTKVENRDISCLVTAIKFRNSLTKASIHVSVSYIVWYMDGSGKWSEDSDVLIKKFDGDNPASFQAPIYIYRNERIGGENGRLESNRYIGSTSNWHTLKSGYPHYKIKVKVITGGKVYLKSILIFDPDSTWSTPVIVDVQQIEKFLLLPSGADAIPIGDKESW
jgi:hypothetical protein